MKTYEIVYISSAIEKVAVKVQAESKADAIRQFRIQHGEYTVCSVAEVK